MQARYRTVTFVLKHESQFVRIIGLIIGLGIRCQTKHAQIAYRYKWA